jgi:hypothetical protein
MTDERLTKTINIGEEVFAFVPTVDGKVEIFKDVVLGVFINKEQKLLFYNLSKFSVPAYSVARTQAEIDMLFNDFESYRAIAAIQKEQFAKDYDALTVDYRFDTFIDSLQPKEKKNEKIEHPADAE